jgi:hypothetical protein
MGGAFSGWGVQPSRREEGALGSVIGDPVWPISAA